MFVRVVLNNIQTSTSSHLYFISSQLQIEKAIEKGVIGVIEGNVKMSIVEIFTSTQYCHYQTMTKKKGKG